MTSLIAWTGADSRGNSSLYLASDSRISWGKSTAQEFRVWDSGRKVLASIMQPEIVGYFGDALFPSFVLGQCMDLIDRGVLFRASLGPDRKAEILSKQVEDAMFTFPDRLKSSFGFLYGTRHSEGLGAQFRLFRTLFVKGSLESQIELDLPNASQLIGAYGSGKISVEGQMKLWEKGDAGGTSRAVFSSFCDSVESGKDPYSGGPTQLIGLYRKGPAKCFGTIQSGKGNVAGMSVAHSTSFDSIEWRNSLFERCDGGSLEPLDGAQKQPKSK